MPKVHVEHDLVFAEINGEALALDLYRPDVDIEVPVVLYLHGGGWQVGDKSADAEHRLEALARNGVAVASANYRFASTSSYPAQVHDAKAAVRWLRGQGGSRGLRTDRIGAWGASAGAYLASMLGLTAGDDALEGEVGGHLDQSSQVDAVVHWFGQSDLASNSRRTWLEKEVLAPPFENALLGLDEVDPLDPAVLTASPLHRVHPGSPPFLLAHGDRDRITPPSETLALHDALVRAGVQSTCALIGGAGHEGPGFDGPANLAMTAAWLTAQLATPEETS